MKRLLLITDFQVDFVNGSLGFENAEKIDDEICKLIEEYKSNNDSIIMTMDTHFESTYMNSEEGKNLPIFHCIEGTSGWDVFGRVKELTKDVLTFKKPTFGCVELVEYFKNNKFDEVTLCGIDTSICVLSNAVIAKSCLENAHVRIIKKACGCGDKLAEENAIKALKRIHVEVVE